MSLDTYSDLVSEVQDWLFGRTDLAAKVPTFIRLCEAKLNRTLKCRQMEERATATVDLVQDAPEYVSLPGDFHSMRRLRLLNGAGITPKKPLSFVVAAQMDDLRNRFATAGEPVYFTIVGDELELLPVPAIAYEFEMTYRKYIPALTASNTTNWLLTLAPDAYLYGSLMEAAPYLRDDERIATWATGLSGAIDQLNNLSNEATYNAGPLVVRRRGSY